MRQQNGGKFLLLGSSIASAVLATANIRAEGITALSLEQLEQQQQAALVSSASPAYVDNLIDEDISEDAPPSHEITTPAEEPAEGIRFLNMDLELRHSKNNKTDSQSHQQLDINAYRQTPTLGNLRLEAQLARQQGSALPSEQETSGVSATLHQTDLLLNEKWEMDNTLGVVRSFQNSLLGQSRNTSLPSKTYAGIASRAMDGETEVRVMAGQKGEVRSTTGFESSNQKVVGASVVHSINKQWVVGAQGWQADGDDKTHQEASAVVQHTAESGKHQTKAQILKNDSATGVWVDTEYKHDRFQHQAGAYMLKDGLTWMGEDIPDNTEGAYWRMDYSHPRFNTHSGIEWQNRKSDSTTSGDTQELRLSQSISYQYDKTTRVGGQLSHTRTQGASDHKTTTAKAFASRSWSNGQDARIQVSLKQSGESNPATGNKTDNRTTELDYSHHWLLPSSNDLSWQINIQNNQNEADSYNTYQTGLDWQRHLQDGNSIGASWTMSKSTGTGSDKTSHNYRAYANKKINKFLDGGLNLEQTHDDAGNSSQGVSVNLSYHDSWGKPLGRRNIRSGKIQGVVFFDENNDGRRQPLEKKAVNIEILLNGQAVGYSDQNGEFEIRQTPVGTHQLEPSIGSIPLPWELSADFDNKIKVGLRDTTVIEIPLTSVHE